MHTDHELESRLAFQTLNSLLKILGQVARLASRDWRCSLRSVNNLVDGKSVSHSTVLSRGKQEPGPRLQSRTAFKAKWLGEQRDVDVRGVAFQLKLFNRNK